MKTIAEMTKEELGTYLAPLTELASKMIQSGVLKKNVIRHFTNKGLSYAAAENLTLLLSFLLLFSYCMFLIIQQIYILIINIPNFRAKKKRLIS